MAEEIDEVIGRAEPEPAATSTLCWKCIRLLRRGKCADKLILDDKISFKRAWKHVVKKSLKGCEFCTLISSRIQWLMDGPFKKSELAATISTKSIEFELRGVRRRGERSGNALANFADLELLRLEIRVREEGNHQWEEVETLNVAAAGDNPAASYINRRPRIYDIASENSFHRAKEWLNSCGNSHNCCPQLEPVLLPTRVIDVGISTSTQQKLLVTNGISGYYTALSYCWGAKPQPLVTITSNMEALCDDIPTSSLAKTIQDAIFATRQLGFRYIWVDALCIIQDSTADKGAEIKQMSNIYETATVTIVAASAKDCTEGFLQRRSYPWGVQDWKSFKLPIRCPNDKLGELILEPEDPYFTGDQPINHRGWTLQEFLLPPRKFIYSRTQLIWQCRSAQAELGNRAREIDGIRKDLVKVQILPIVLSSHASSSPTISSPTPEILHDVRFNWQILVGNYITRSLTNREDVLPGISGIASKFASFLREEYKAGLWYSKSDKSNFVQELLWSVQLELVFSSPDLERPNVYTAPSWSWAGQNLPITWQASPFWTTQEDMVCSIEECLVELATVAPFGQVKGGSLKIRALTRKFQSIDAGEFIDRLQFMVDWLKGEDVLVLLDDTIETLAAKFGSAVGSVWCILLTKYGGLLIVPLLEDKWMRIGIIHEKDATQPSHKLDTWFQNTDFKTHIII